jgi:hypothetical protein
MTRKKKFSTKTKCQSVSQTFQSNFALHFSKLKNSTIYFPTCPDHEGNMIYELYTSVALALWGGHCELFLIIPHFIISRLMAVSLGYKDFSSSSSIHLHRFLVFSFPFSKDLALFLLFLDSDTSF